jgi:broad specificity phosphatase PhoE
MVIAIRKINTEAKERAAKVKDEKVAEAGASLRDKLSTIEEDIYQVRNRANEDPLNFPIKLNNQIAALARAIETGDNPPTDQEYEVFKVLSARLEAIVARYQQALKNDLSRFNTLLVSHGSTEIKPSTVLNTPTQ